MIMDGVRVGNKKPDMTIAKSYPVGDISGNGSPHVADANKTVTGGSGVYGMPLMSEAAKKAK